MSGGNEWAELAVKLVGTLGDAPLTRSQTLQVAALNAQLAVAQELRTANLIEALRLGTSGLDDVVPTTKSESTAARQARANLLRAQIRAGLGIG